MELADQEKIDWIKEQLVEANPAMFVDDWPDLRRRSPILVVSPSDFLKMGI